MIDYLEALLEEETEENWDGLLPGRRILVRAAARSSPASQESEEENRDGEESLSLEETAGRENAFWPVSAAPAGQAAWPEGEVSLHREPGEPEGKTGNGGFLPERIKRERRAAEMALLPPAMGQETEAAALYETLRRAARTARTGRQGAGTIALTVPDRAVSAPGLTLSDIDRAVQRDARRFDGGYTLY